MRFIFSFWLVVLLYSAASDVEAEPALLQVEAKLYKVTEHSPAEEKCADAANSCIPWTWWHLYSAKVKKVIAGEFDKETFVFAYLLHSALSDESMNNIYIVVDQYDQEGSPFPEEAEYYVVHRGSPANMFCFAADVSMFFEDSTLPTLGVFRDNDYEDFCYRLEE